MELIKQLDRKYRELEKEKKKLLKEITRTGYTLKHIRGYIYLYKSEWDKFRKKQKWKCLGNAAKVNYLIEKIDKEIEEKVKKVEEIDEKIDYIETKLKEILESI